VCYNQRNKSSNFTSKECLLAELYQLKQRRPLIMNHNIVQWNKWH